MKDFDYSSILAIVISTTMNTGVYSLDMPS